MEARFQSGQGSLEVCLVRSPWKSRASNRGCVCGHVWKQSLIPSISKTSTRRPHLLHRRVEPSLVLGLPDCGEMALATDQPALAGLPPGPDSEMAWAPTDRSSSACPHCPGPGEHRPAYRVTHHDGRGRTSVPLGSVSWRRIGPCPVHKAAGSETKASLGGMSILPDTQISRNA